jgi:tetraacyldisaccharide 4'-kinase
MMQAPGFWQAPPGKPGLWPRLLGPAGALYGLAGRLRRWRVTPQRAGVPVICVGNITAGGAGKTPTAIALLERLTALGAAPHALTRGYGGRLAGPHRVDIRQDSAAETGDEPLLLAAWAPAWVARDRVAGARAAEAAGAGVLVMDDGFQNPSLAKDLSLVVVDAAVGFGNGRLIPAGPLREPVADGLARADAVVLIGSEPQAAQALARWPALQARPLLRAWLEPLATGLPVEGTDIVAFAGIGRPEKFFETLTAMGARVIAAHAFPDHATYPRPLLRRMLAEARNRDALLVTTEKDAVRLPASFRPEVMALPVRLRFAEPARLDQMLTALLAGPEV